MPRMMLHTHKNGASDTEGHAHLTQGSYWLLRSLMVFQSRGKMLSFIRLLNTHKIFIRSS